MGRLANAAYRSFCCKQSACLHCILIREHSDGIQLVVDGGRTLFCMGSSVVAGMPSIVSLKRELNSCSEMFRGPVSIRKKFEILIEAGNEQKPRLQRNAPNTMLPPPRPIVIASDSVCSSGRLGSSPFKRVHCYCLRDRVKRIVSHEVIVTPLSRHSGFVLPSCRI